MLLPILERIFNIMMYTVKEFAEEINYDISQVYKLIKSGQLTPTIYHTNTRKTYRFHPEYTEDIKINGIPPIHDTILKVRTTRKKRGKKNKVDNFAWLN